MYRVGTERERARVLHDQVVELVEAARSDELPVVPAFRHRLEGGITALEAVLGLPPSLGEGVFTSLERCGQTGGVRSADRHTSRCDLFPGRGPCCSGSQ